MSREYLTVQSQIWWKVAVTKAVNSHSQLISSACQSGCRVQICHSNWKCVKLLTCHDKALDVARGRKEYEKLLPKQRKAVQAFISVFAYRDLSFVHRVWTVLCGRRNLVDNNNYWRPKHSYKITLIMTYQCWVMLIEVVRFCSQTITLSSIQCAREYWAKCWVSMSNEFYLSGKHCQSSQPCVLWACLCCIMWLTSVFSVLVCWYRYRCL